MLKQKKKPLKKPKKINDRTIQQQETKLKTTKKNQKIYRNL